jgi:hypothetical protein
VIHLGRFTRRRGAALVVVAGIAGIVVLASACFSPPPPPPPPFPGLGGTITPYTGSECKTVMVAGDSLANQLGLSLQSRLEASGRCANVVNESVASTSVGDWAPGGSDDLRRLLDAVHPDLVVVDFIGNEGQAGPQWDDPNYLADAAADATAIINAAKSRNIPIFWVIPPIAAWNCNFTQLSAQRFQEWEQWIVANAGALTGNPLVDWRRPFGGEQYSSSFTFTMGVEEVRAPDCVHFDFTPGNGQIIAADATVLAIEQQWTSPAGTSPSAPTTAQTNPTTTTTSGTTTPTEPSTTSSSVTTPQQP